MALIVYFGLSSGAPGISVKEKAVAGGITLAACLLSVLLLFKPDIPGPSAWMIPVLKPLIDLLGLD
ncbi:hypothetical protein [Paenibacillus ferrarius]|uniref:hypothetical protein n=1 Tax=Paenibacillus ferrarius TaxID=1469647 RepID=UPI003D2C4B0B